MEQLSRIDTLKEFVKTNARAIFIGNETDQGIAHENDVDVTGSDVRRIDKNPAKNVLLRLVRNGRETGNPSPSPIKMSLLIRKEIELNNRSLASLEPDDRIEQNNLRNANVHKPITPPFNTRLQTRFPSVDSPTTTSSSTTSLTSQDDENRLDLTLRINTPASDRNQLLELEISIRNSAGGRRRSTKESIVINEPPRLPPILTYDDYESLEESEESDDEIAEEIRKEDLEEKRQEVVHEHEEVAGDDVAVGTEQMTGKLEGAEEIMSNRIEDRSIVGEDGKVYYLQKIKEISSRLHSFTLPSPRPVMGVRQLKKRKQANDWTVDRKQWKEERVSRDSSLDDRECDDASIVHRLVMDSYSPILMEHERRTTLRRTRNNRRWSHFSEELMQESERENGRDLGERFDVPKAAEIDEKTLSFQRDRETHGADEEVFNSNMFLREALGDELEKYETCGTFSSISTVSRVYSTDHSYDTADASALISYNTNSNARTRSTSTLTREQNARNQQTSIVLNEAKVAATKRDPSDIEASDIEPKRIGPMVGSEETIQPRRRRIMREIEALVDESSLQYQVMLQTAKAIKFCRRHPTDFELQRVEAERLLLVATRKRQILLDEIGRLEAKRQQIADGHEEDDERESCAPALNYGRVRLSNVKCFVNDRDESIDRLYVLLATCDRCTIATDPVRVNPFYQIHFDEQRFAFDRLRADFTIRLELYTIALRSNAHELEEDDDVADEEVEDDDDDEDDEETRCLQNRSRLKRFFHKASAVALKRAVARRRSGERKSRFRLCASVALTVDDLCAEDARQVTITRQLDTTPIDDASLPIPSLTGDVQLDAERDVALKETVAGFVTLKRLEWRRLWCRLIDGRLVYWTDPHEDECDEAGDESKIGTHSGQIDLRSCASRRVDEAPRERCARPRTLEIAIERDRGRTNRRECYYLSMDTAEELREWKAKINAAIECLGAWKLTKPS